MNGKTVSNPLDVYVIVNVYRIVIKLSGFKAGEPHAEIDFSIFHVRNVLVS
ncbi:hypothetical protein [Peribacillus butanolivorans]